MEKRIIARGDAMEWGLDGSVGIVYMRKNTAQQHVGCRLNGFRCDYIGRYDGGGELVNVHFCWLLVLQWNRKQDS